MQHEIAIVDVEAALAFPELLLEELKKCKQDEFPEPAFVPPDLSAFPPFIRIDAGLVRDSALAADNRLFLESIRRLDLDLRVFLGLVPFHQRTPAFSNWTAQ